jgi:hypothetical protein
MRLAMGKPIWCLIVLSIALIAPVAQDVAGDRNALDVEYGRWIEQVMTKISSVKPGMTRQSLSQFFREDGGLQFPAQTRYVYKRCPYVKIDVEFSVDAGHTFNADDKIVKISRPYLEYPFSD